MLSIHSASLLPFLLLTVKKSHACLDHACRRNCTRAQSLHFLLCTAAIMNRWIMDVWGNLGIRKRTDQGSLYIS